ncbi:MAG: GntR family transcriptional regulator [Pseudomonadota bacterium]
MTKNPKELCYQDLKRRILTTALEPGAALDEASLSAEYGMSRTPLREVLQRLAGNGYLEIEANRGASVASMNVQTLRTFFQTAPMIYANIARLAAENRTHAQLVALKADQRDFSQSVAKGDATEAALSNHRFHAAIGRMAENPYLMACLDRLLIDHTRLGQTFYRPKAAAEKLIVMRAVQQHDEMIAAIEAQEPSLAMEITLQHWDLSRDRMERFVRPDPLPIDVVALKDRSHAL